MTNINVCDHEFGNWKKMKKDVLDLESDAEDSPSYFGTVFHRKCKKCGFVDTRLEKKNIKKGKTKHLSLKNE